MTRKDTKGRALRKGESQRRQDGRYIYTYQDPFGKRCYVYATDLLELRRKEDDIKRNQLSGLDIYLAGRATLNDTFDRYMSLKHDLRDTTRSNYLYMYDRYVRPTAFGRKKVAEIKYSEVVQFYQYLIKDKGIAVNTLDSIHCLIHPVFHLAVRDRIISVNPSDGVMKEIKRNFKSSAARRALTEEQQKAFMDYIANHPIYYHWWPLFVVLLGTGCRIGEVVGLRWKDLDFDNRMIDINHTVVYYADSESREMKWKVSPPKTEAGIRRIPMLDVVYDAFQMVKEEQKELGTNQMEIDGMTGFVFANRYGLIIKPSSVNAAIKRISASYNAEEIINAKRQHREPVILPNFSCHHLRHTFATRLCEQTSNLKMIQSIMGHADITVTMDTYADATSDQRKSEVFQTLKIDIF